MNEPREKPLRVEPQESALDWAHATGATAPLLKELQVRSERRHRRRRSAWVGAAVALVAVGLFWNIRSPLSSVAPHESKPGLVLQPAQRHLPDGTVVDLREGSELTSVFSNSERSVVLSGEAHFSVAKDAARPFVVRAGGVAVRAVGTAFNVKVVRTVVTVTVTEGVVSLAAPLPGSEDVTASPTLLEAGQHAVLAPAIPVDITTPAAGSVAALLAWRVPRLEFSATPLREAVELFNRHSSTRLAIAEASLGSIQVSGIVRADNPRALVELLSANYDVVAHAAADGSLVLARTR